MERGMMGNCHVPCGAGEKLEMISKAYLLPTLIKEGLTTFLVELIVLKGQKS